MEPFALAAKNFSILSFFVDEAGAPGGVRGEGRAGGRGRGRERERERERGEEQKERRGWIDGGSDYGGGRRIFSFLSFFFFFLESTLTNL